MSTYILNWTNTSTLDMAMKLGSFLWKSDQFQLIFFKEQVI